MASLLVSLAVVLGAALLLRNPLRRHPLPFYVAMAVLVGLGAYCTLNPSPFGAVRAVAFAFQKDLPCLRS